MADRAGALADIETVDYVTSFSETNPANIIKELKPDILVKGGDWKAREVIGKDIVEAGGGRVVIIPYIKGYSTSSIIKSRQKK